MASGKSLEAKADRPEPVQLCVKPGCGKPWPEHLTKKGTILKKYDDDTHFTSAGGIGRRRLRSLKVGLGEGSVRGSLAAQGRHALPAIATHVAVRIETDEQRAELAKRGIRLKGRKTTASFQAAPSVFKTKEPTT